MLFISFLTAMLQKYAYDYGLKSLLNVWIGEMTLEHLIECSYQFGIED